MIKKYKPYVETKALEQLLGERKAQLLLDRELIRQWTVRKLTTMNRSIVFATQAVTDNGLEIWVLPMDKLDPDNDRHSEILASQEFFLEREFVTTKQTRGD